MNALSESFFIILCWFKLLGQFRTGYPKSEVNLSSNAIWDMIVLISSSHKNLVNVKSNFVFPQIFLIKGWKDKKAILIIA